MPVEKWNSEGHHFSHLCRSSTLQKKKCHSIISANHWNFQIFTIEASTFHLNKKSWISLKICQTQSYWVTLSLENSYHCIYKYIIFASQGLFVPNQNNQPNLHSLRMTPMTMSSSHSQLWFKKKKQEGALFTKQSSHEWRVTMLFQDLSWPKALPLCNLLLVVKLPNSTIKAIYFSAFLLVVLPVYDHPSPSGAGIILVELQYHRVCQQ